LKQQQNILTQKMYQEKLQKMINKIATLSLKASLGFEHIKWQERVNKVLSKKNLLILKQRELDLAWERADEIQK